MPAPEVPEGADPLEMSCREEISSISRIATSAESNRKLGGLCIVTNSGLYPPVFL